MIIKRADLKKLDNNIASLFCSWNEISHCKVSRFCTFVGPLYFIRTAFIAILLCVSVCACVYLCKRVCSYVYARAFVYFYCKWLLLPKLMSETNIYVQVSDIILRTIADLLTQNFPHLCLHLQNSEIPTQQSTGIKIIWSVWCCRNNEWMDIYWYKSDVSQPFADISL